MLSEGLVRTELKKVIDPEVMLNIVDMGLVYDIEVADNNDIAVTMTLTTPHCPMGPQIISDVQETAGGLAGAGEVEVTIVWDPPWSPALFSPELKEEMRELGMEFDEDVINAHSPPPREETPPPAPLPAKPKKRGGFWGWLFGR